MPLWGLYYRVFKSFGSATYCLINGQSSLNYRSYLDENENEICQSVIFRSQGLADDLSICTLL